MLNSLTTIELLELGLSETDIAEVRAILEDLFTFAAAAKDGPSWKEMTT